MTAWRYGHELCHQLDLEPGRLYRALMGLADLGLLEAAWESEAPADRPARHRYRLSGPGRAHAARLAAGSPLHQPRAVQTHRPHQA